MLTFFTEYAAGTSSDETSLTIPGDSASSNVQHELDPDKNRPGVSDAKQLELRQEQSRSETSQNSASIDTTSSTEQAKDRDFLPQLPLPPRALPQSEWTDPPQPSSEFPRIPTAHATLPSGFNPYPEGQPAPNIVPQAKLLSKEIGPQLPTRPFDGNVRETASGGSRDYGREGAKPKASSSPLMQSDRDAKRLGRKRQSSDIYETEDWSQPQPESELNLGRPRKQRAVDRCSFPRIQQSSSSAPSGRAPMQGGRRAPGFLPRQVQAQQQKDTRSEHQGTTGL